MPRPKVRDPSRKAPGDVRLIERVRAALVGVPKVNEKRMFGGTGFMVRGNLCITARPARIMCRIDPSTHNAAINRKGCRTVVMQGSEYMGYVHIDASAIKTEKALVYWVSRALEFNRSLPEKIK